jgi:hypothetical protein
MTSAKLLHNTSLTRVKNLMLGKQDNDRKMQVRSSLKPYKNTQNKN